MRRRNFLQAVGSTIVGGRMLALGGGALALGGCMEEPLGPVDPWARLEARPNGAASLNMSPGVKRLKVGGTDFVAYLPQSAISRPTIPLLVFLHGANREVDVFLDAFRPMCDNTGVMLLAPYADYQSWDALTRGGFGPDREGIDRVLRWTFERVPMIPAEIAMSGFSDGASYALAMGRANGDIFANRIIAFAPGMLLNVQIPIGLPPIVIAHGNQDTVLPFENARDSIAPSLVAAGYDVDFREFDGGHAVSLSVAAEQITLLGGVGLPV